MNNRKQLDDDHTRLLQNILIVQLATLSVKQQDIRKIVGVDMRRVTSIVRHVKRALKKNS